MARKPKILALAGSLRANSYSERIVKTAAVGAERAGAAVTYLDLRAHPLPIYNHDEAGRDGFPENARKLQKILSEHDGLLVASPEYNGSLTGALKNAIDWASRATDEYRMGAVFNGKFAAIMTQSPGAFGGIRCLGHLRDILTVLLVNLMPTQIAVGKVHEMFDGGAAEMTDEKMRKTLEDLGASLAEMLKKTHDEVKAAAE